MPYNYVADSIHTEKLCSRLSSSDVNFFWLKTAILRFWAPFGGLRATYDVHLRLIGKRLVDFPLVLIDLFLLDVTPEALRANIDWKSAISLQRGLFNPKFQVEGVTFHQSFFFSENYAKWSFVFFWYLWADFFFRFVTIHAFDRQMDGQTDSFLLTRPPSIQCTAVKTQLHWFLHAPIWMELVYYSFIIPPDVGILSMSYA